MNFDEAIRLTGQLDTIDIGGDPECSRCEGSGLDSSGESLCRCCEHPDRVITCGCTGCVDVYDLRDYSPEQVRRYGQAVERISSAYIALEGEKGAERIVIRGEWVDDRLERAFQNWLREQAALFARSLGG